MKKTRITDTITYVQPGSMANFTSCSGIMIDSGTTVWIDMNMGPEDTPDLLKKERPGACIITHYHLDHSIWTRHVRDFTGAEIFIPRAEEKYLTSLDYVIEHTAGVLGMAGPWKQFVVHTLGYRALEDYHTYDAGTTFREWVPEMVPVETPGHSPGHTSFYFPDDNILFSGDMGLDRFGPWYGWADCSIPKLVESILRLDGLETNLVLTSHGGVLKKDIQVHWRHCIRHLIQREKKIRAQLDAGKTEKAIVSAGIFFKDKESVKDPMKSFLYMWDTAMFRHHERIIRQGGLSTYFPDIFQWPDK